MKHSKTAFISAISALIFQLSTHVHSSEIEPFEIFQNMERSDFVRHCMPKVHEEHYPRIERILSAFCDGNEKPIYTDPSLSSETEISIDYGFQFKTSLPTLGPLLQFCGHGDEKHILTIGGGYGNTETMVSLTNNAVVHAVEISRQQQEVMEKNISKNIKPLPHKQFTAFQDDFSKENLPEEMRGCYHAANIDNVFHFLTDEETVTMIENMAQALGDDGFLFLTTLDLKNIDRPGMPKEIYNKIIQDAHNGAPTIYHCEQLYQTTKLRSGIKFTCEHITSLNQIAEFPEDDGTSVLFYGRHYHTQESLEQYLSPYFDIVDVMNWRSHTADQISIIAKKRLQE